MSAPTMADRMDPQRGSLEWESVQLIIAVRRFVAGQTTLSDLDLSLRDAERRVSRLLPPAEWCDVIRRGRPVGGTPERDLGDG